MLKAGEETPTSPSGTTGSAEEPVRTPAQPSAEDIIRRFQEEKPTIVPVLQ